jgi:hypothetical protein
MNLLSTVKSTKASVIVEALNLIFDVYSDAAFDYDLPVFCEGGFLNILKQVLSSVRSMVNFFFLLLPHFFSIFIEKN